MDDTISELVTEFGLAHGGSYSIYYALAIASKEVQANHR